MAAAAPLHCRGLTWLGHARCAGGAPDEETWPKKLEISHASQILTNDRQSLVLSYLSNYYCMYNCWNKAEKDMRC